jgi:hypothetical protein
MRLVDQIASHYSCIRRADVSVSSPPNVDRSAHQETEGAARSWIRVGLDVARATHHGGRSGLRVRSSENNEKSRSRVSKASTPWAMHRAAIRASCTMGPRTRGKVTRRPSVSQKAAVSPRS